MINKEINRNILLTLEELRTSNGNHKFINCSNYTLYPLLSSLKPEEIDRHVDYLHEKGYIKGYYKFIEGEKKILRVDHITPNGYDYFEAIEKDHTY